MENNILYIEDNPDNMVLVKRALESRGYRLLEAMNGVDGVAVAEKEEVDLILLDVNLPDIDGYEVARRLRKSMLWLMYPSSLLPQML
jgi:CheY-like chemotaxis protein